MEVGNDHVASRQVLDSQEVNGECLVGGWGSYKGCVLVAS